MDKRRNENWGVDGILGEGVHLPPKLLRGRALHAAGSEVAAAVTRSHPVPIHQTAGWTSTKTEQKLPTDLPTERCVLVLKAGKCLICLVGAPGLEPGTR